MKDTYHILPQQVQLVALEPRDLEPQRLGLRGLLAADARRRLLSQAPGLVRLRRAHALQPGVAVRIHHLVQLQLAVQRAVVALRHNPLLLLLLL